MLHQPEKQKHEHFLSVCSTWYYTVFVCLVTLWLLHPLGFGHKAFLIALRPPPIKMKPTALSLDLCSQVLIGPETSPLTATTAVLPWTL